MNESAPAPAHASEREARLAAQLRENLRRRKAQARALAGGPADEEQTALPKPDTKS